ncbi:MAG: zinc-binding alcohol dehydrogenase family protein [Alphaproteobacteria bacterium]|nr:zinc-binding alcohol dehydrogenase family protein [Alphaproteobacteria bacterium]
MKALQFDRTGSLDHLKLVELPVPEMRPGEVLVRVAAAGINPSDVKNVLGRFAYTTLPRVPGRDFAGEIIAGPASRIGQRVFGSGKELGFTADGSHAGFVVVPEDGVATMPDGLSWAQAASLGVPYVTAWDGLERAGLHAHARVLIVGAGAVGRAALALARWRGADTVIAVRRTEQAQELAAAGHRVIQLGTEQLSVALSAAFGAGVDIVFDTTGAWTAACVEALAAFGRLVIIAAPPSGTVELPTLSLYRRGGSLIGVNSLLYDARACARILERLAQGFVNGGLTLPCQAVEWAAEDGVTAYRMLEQGGSQKIVLTGFAS